MVNVQRIQLAAASDNQSDFTVLIRTNAGLGGSIVRAQEYTFPLQMLENNTTVLRAIEPLLADTGKRLLLCPNEPMAISLYAEGHTATFGLRKSYSQGIMVVPNLSLKAYGTYLKASSNDDAMAIAESLRALGAWGRILACHRWYASDSNGPHLQIFHVPAILPKEANDTLLRQIAHISIGWNIAKYVRQVGLIREAQRLKNALALAETIVTFPN